MNQITQLFNSSCHSWNNNIMALVDATTGLEIDNFSVTVQNVLDLSAQETMQILQALNQPLTGSVAIRRTRILIAVGVTMQTTTML
ncbi:hypothetical protein DFH94DRAFT_748442 [Russula ochroleuca]|uniref:Uncharacterized protein n=1 Tax=Russula ochroleuca TaxID=152965 RepID=A0A9P5T8D7_9AGAM|nr:hypothetical protein DFH94DRAFT_748442 [Russula ochroleuca]